MRILLISYLFPPLVNPQALLSARYAKYLAKAGHTLSVLAASNLAHLNSDHGIDLSILSDLGQVEVDFIPDTTKTGFLHELSSKVVYHEWYRTWVRRLLALAKRKHDLTPFDVIYSLSAPLASNVAGLFAKRTLKIPWIAHFSDPPFSAFDKRFKSPLRNYLTFWDENRILREADGVTFVNEDTMLRTTRREKFLRKKSLVLTHCFDGDFYSLNPQPRSANGAIRFVYVGSLYSRRRPFDVIQAFDRVASLNSGNRQGFEFHIYGAVEAEILSSVASETRKWLVFHGPVPYRESIRAMEEADYLLLIDMPDKENLYTPSKLIDYMAAFRPLIGITSSTSNSARLLRSMGYRVISPGDIDSLTEILNVTIAGSLVAVTKEHLQLTEMFRADRMATQLIGFLKRIIESRH